jgi:hypothetical protein
MAAQVRSAFLYLADGRLFVRRDDGSIVEADGFERRFAADLLAVQATGAWDPVRGLELLPPAES